MGKRTLFAAIVWLCTMMLPLSAAFAEDAPEAAPAAPEVASEAAVLIEAGTGNMLYARNPDTLMYPASITKIVTAVIAIETTDPDEIVTVSKEARNEEGTRIYLAEGEQVRMGDLLYGLLMNSGNDAATAIAEHIDGTKSAFAERMNRFVREKVGVTNTHFVNPSGLPDPAHYTTASDMAKIAQYAMRNETFRKIVSTKTMPWNGKEWQSSLINHNRMLWNYEGANGVKNGYTVAAGNTLVTSAVRGGMELIVVVLKSPSANQAYADTTKLLDYGFAGFQVRTLIEPGASFTVGEGADQTEWRAETPIAAAVPKLGPAPAPYVEANGEVFADTAAGTQLLGQLTKVERGPGGADGGAKDDAEVKTASLAAAEDRDGVPTAVWVSLTAAALFGGAAAWQAMRRRGFERQRGRYERPGK